MMRNLVLLGVALATGCATMGPMPAATGMSAVPTGRTDAELQAGFMPGYFLSESTTEEPNAEPIEQLSLAVEPGAVVPGLVAGFRIYGPSHDTRGEPMLGYRRAFGADRRIAIAGVAFGSHGGASGEGASYQATRAGGELGFDVRGFDESRYAEPHLIVSLSMTGIFAEGTYCLDDDNRMHGVDCPDKVVDRHLTTASLSGVYPSATAGVALDFARHLDNPFHGVRVMMIGGGGLMPRVTAGQENGTTRYFTLGVALSIGVGSR